MKTTIYAVAIVVVSILLVFGLTGWGIAWVLAWLGIASVGTILWCSAALPTLVFLITSKGARQEVRAKPLLSLIAFFGATAVAAFAHWVETGSRTAGWVSFISAVVTIILFLKYSCRWGRWCRKFNLWWHLDGKKKTLRALRDMWVVGRRNARKGASHFLTFAVPIIRSRAMEISIVASGLMTYWLYNGDRNLAHQSPWFWAFGALTAFLAIIYSPKLRQFIARILVGFAGGIVVAYKKVYQTIHGWWKFVYWTILPATAVFLFWLWENHYRKYIWFVAGAGFGIFILVHFGGAINAAIDANNPWKLPDGKKKPTTKEEKAIAAIEKRRKAAEAKAAGRAAEEKYRLEHP
jgi:hypothetical protein